MLLFVRKQYADAIRAGSKTFEIRAGSRYAKIVVGSELSINGQFRVRVLSTERHSRKSLLAALPGWRDAIESCYPQDTPPYFVFHFSPPPAKALPLLDS